MDKESKYLCIVGGVAAVLLYAFRPGRGRVFGSSKKYAAPAIASLTDKEMENATLAIKALRAAIKAGESPANQTQIIAEIKDEYKIVLKVKAGLIYATDLSGKAIANEK